MLDGLTMDCGALRAGIMMLVWRTPVCLWSMDGYDS
jgi:hypothetical protein